jgi:hypothetical protein
LQGGQGTKLNQPDYLCRRVLAAKVSKNGCEKLVDLLARHDLRRVSRVHIMTMK